MEKFIKKISLGLMLLMVILLILNRAYVQTDYYKNLNDMRKFDQVPEHIDIANFGASHSYYAFSWNEFQGEFTGFNMALEAQKLEYDEAIFNKYYDRFDGDSTIVFEIMYKSLYEDEEFSKPYASDVTRYYRILDKKDFPLWNLEDAIAYYYLPVIGNRQDAIQSIILEYISKFYKERENNSEKPISPKMEGDPTQVLIGFTKESMEKEGNRRAKNFISYSGNQNLNKQYEALIRMIKKCKDKGINVVLVTAPTLPCFYEAYPEEFIDKFYKDIQNICNKYNIQYIDYTGDERLLLDYRWYRDTDHLNQYGSKVFMQYFMEDNASILNLK